MKQFPEPWQKYDELCRKYKLSRGMTGPEDFNHLMEYAEQIPQGGVYLEIGVANGSSLMAVAQFRPDVQCFGIEVNEGCKADKNVEKEGLKNATVIFGQSENVCKIWEKPIDMLFIDGEHYFKNILWDCLGWFPFVKKEGVVLFHDYENPAEGKFHVGAAVEIFRGHPKYECHIPSLDEIISTSMVILKMK